MRHNRNNQDLVKEERPHLKPLPLRRRADYDELTVRVSSSSTINVRHIIYSVPSRLVGQLLRVRLWDDRLSCYVGSNEVMSCPRVRPEKGQNAGPAYRLPACDRQSGEKARRVLPCHPAK